MTKTQNLLEKIKEAGLVGRGGAGFPSHIKWKAVKEAKSDIKYVICNASEGELGIFKDFYILENYPEKVFGGMMLAMEFIGTKIGYININENYYNRLQKKIDQILSDCEKKGYKIHLFKEHPSYPGGEETALLNAIEGKRLTPRLKPPYPTDSGLFGKPSLIHNVETLYNIENVANGTYENKRFYSLSGLVKNKGVFCLPADFSAKQVLEATDNLPDFDYFIQLGGSASGPCINSLQAETEKVSGAGSIEIYRTDTPIRALFLRWFKFYNEQSCGKCTPCREGTHQLHKLIKNNEEIPWKEIDPILEVLAETSFCALGRSVPVPIYSYVKNIKKD